MRFLLHFLEISYEPARANKEARARQEILFSPSFPIVIYQSECNSLRHPCYAANPLPTSILWPTLPLNTGVYLPPSYNKI